MPPPACVLGRDAAKESQRERLEHAPGAGALPVGADGLYPHGLRKLPGRSSEREGSRSLSELPITSSTPRPQGADAAMQIGDLLIHDGRRYVVRGFDPLGVSPRMVYLEDVGTGAHSVLPFEDLKLSTKRRGGRLRLVRKPNSTESRQDRPGRS